MRLDLAAAHIYGDGPLREKLEVDPSNPRYIKVVWGKGYKMEKHL